MRGRLNRESSPVPGEKPGFTPQHDSTGQGDFVDTSPVNPMPVKDSDVGGKLDALKTVTEGNKITLPADYPDGAVKAELEAIKATQSEILARLDQPIPTQVTGSNVEKVKFRETFLLENYTIIEPWVYFGENGRQRVKNNLKPFGIGEISNIYISVTNISDVAAHPDCGLKLTFDSEPQMNDLIYYSFENLPAGSSIKFNINNLQSPAIAEILQIPKLSAKGLYLQMRGSAKFEVEIIGGLN